MTKYIEDSDTIFTAFATQATYFVFSNQLI